MAVQGKSEAMICDRCFASVKEGSEFCPECGAPIGSSPAEGSDAAIYAELARANLLRMRGDYKAALEQCRTILRKFPNNVSANQLLGDLCQETGDLEQAKEWYELALDIAPNHAQLQKKLKDVRERLEHQETQGLVDQLGLPPSKPKNGLMAAGLAVMVLAVGGIAYVIGTNKQKVDAPLPKPTVSNAPATNPQSTNPDVENPVQDPPTTAPVTTPAQGSSEETALAQLIGQRSTHGAKLVGLVIDPRTSQLTLTYRVATGEDRKAIGAELAGVTFDNSPTTRLIAIRAVENDAVVYVADARREAYEETKSDAWKAANGNDPAAFAKHLLTQEWPATASEPPAVNTSGDNTGP